MSKLIDKRKCRKTGALIKLYDNRELDLETQLSDGKWELLCCEHSTVMGFETRSNAESFIAWASEWCEPCREVAS
jgi:hypothetical protein